jgi:oxygen-independent coproporphyrinogen-3 oxidase
MPSAPSPTTALETDPTSDTGGFGLYVHWPFCQSKCPYCDFNSHVRAEVDHGRWRDALTREIAYFQAMTPGRTLDAIFFGGGTPSLMPPETVEAVIAAARQGWRFSNAIEITLEANPGSVEADRFAGYAMAGVNRVSLGVQALNDDDLKFLGRMHSHAEALRALEIARETFARYSFDMIYARPGQSVEDWRRELDTALALAGGHISVYQLTIEQGTAFHGLHQRGALQIPDEDTGAALYEATEATLNDAGLPRYEISNHAAPGHECAHNLIYWRAGEWAGAGPGAHGRLIQMGARNAFAQTRTPEAWIKRVENHGHATTSAEKLTADDVAAEALMMGLRLTEGVDLARFQQQTGGELIDFVDAAGLARLQSGGFVDLTSARLTATESGRQRLNAVLEMLLAR